jgi:predicted O-methyltransferase YrrM
MSRFLREKLPKPYMALQETVGLLYYEFFKLGPLARKISEKRLRRMESVCHHPYEVVKRFTGTGLYHSIAPVQMESEITELFDAVRKLNPKVICEIGTDRGGTLYLWSKTIKPDGLIVSIDLPRTYRKSLNRFFHMAFFENQHVGFLRENSQTYACREKVQEILKGKPIDFLFIDADHSYEGVKKDFQLYSPLVRKSGLIAFHDILDECGVDRFWSEIKRDYEYEEIVEHYQQRCAGIGLLHYEPGNRSD